MIRLAFRFLGNGSWAERVRYLLMVLGSAVCVMFLLGAVVVLSIHGNSTDECGPTGGHCVYGPNPPYTTHLLDESGLRPGVAVGTILLSIPVLVFLGQCTRIGTAQRHRRLAALRLAGATPMQVRRLTVLDTGIACGVGSVVGLGGFLAVRAAVAAGQGTTRPLSYPTDVALPAIPTVLIVLLVPLLCAVAATAAMRKVVVTPLGAFRHHRTDAPAAWPAAFLAAGIGLIAVGSASLQWLSTATILYFLILLGAGCCVVGLLGSAAWLAGQLARLVGRRTSRPTLLLAASRLEADPYGQTRATSAVLICVLIASAVEVMRAEVLAPGANVSDPKFMASAYQVVDVAILIAVVAAVFGLVVGNVEAIMERRRSLAALVAAGTRPRTLRRAAFAQNMLPIVPTTLVATAAGACAGALFSGGLDASTSIPVLRLAVIAVLAITVTCVATASGAPFLRQSLRPAELRYD